MKRYFFLFLFFITSFCVFAQSQIKTCVYYDGYWGSWKGGYMCLYGNYGGIIFYQRGTHPSEWQWKFTINNYVTPSKDDIKYHYKNNIWYEYTGTFEYYISDEYQSIKQMFKEYGYPAVNPTIHRVEIGETPCVKRTSSATIKIAPYKNHPQVYNIWFDGVGFAIDLQDSYFRQ